MPVMLSELVTSTITVEVRRVCVNQGGGTLRTPVLPHKVPSRDNKPLPACILHLQRPYVRFRQVSHIHPRSLEGLEDGRGLGLRDDCVVEVFDGGVERRRGGYLVQDGAENEGRAERDEVPGDLGFVLFSKVPCS